ncbi:Major capsid protein L1 [Rhynchospora pubera]|uniref:Major capsid protein L1 n=1 Tax=Rhynchospora pubera TaxID=906938 RepID=A0AAV8GIR1_9POAL|nr:Major capsid protein L1 [Rhynchospora pubera]
MAIPATTSASLLLVVATIIALSVPISARPGRPFHPCNTLLISYSFTSFSSSETSESNSDGSLASLQPSTFITVYRIISPFHGSRHLPQPSEIDRPIPSQSQRDVAPLASSLQDRARDILAVAAGLLFGVGCGALTAATLYFLFAVATNRHVILGGSHYEDEEEEDEYDEIPSPKKGAYVAVPVVETDMATKDGYAKN